MVHQMVSVTNFEIVGPYTLQISFDDATEQIINFEPVLAGYYYSPLRDLAFFNQVQLDAEIQHVKVRGDCCVWWSFFWFGWDSHAVLYFFLFSLYH